MELVNLLYELEVFVLSQVAEYRILAMNLNATSPTPARIGGLLVIVVVLGSVTVVVPTYLGTN